MAKRTVTVEANRRLELIESPNNPIFSPLPPKDIKKLDVRIHYSFTDGVFFYFLLKILFCFLCMRTAQYCNYIKHRYE